MSKSKSKSSVRRSRYSTNVEPHTNNRQTMDPAILNKGSPGPANGQAHMRNSELYQNGKTSSPEQPRSSGAARRPHSPISSKGRFSDQGGVHSASERRPPSHRRNVSPIRTHGEKRKATDAPSGGPRAQRARLDNNGNNNGILKDEAYFRRTMEYPTQRQYPHAPPTLFGDQFISVLHNLGQDVIGLRQEFEESSSRASAHGCTVHCRLPSGETVDADGSGFNKRDAARAAYIHLMCKLHKSGALTELFPPPVTVNEQLLREERDAKLDVYNYAARFGFIPVFSENLVSRHGGNARRGRGQQSGKKLVEVTIEVKEHGIKTSGRGLNLPSAEIAASIRFKEEAEKYHAEHGDESIVIKDSTALNTGNAKMLFDFYKLEHKGSAIEVQAKSARAGLIKTGGSLFKGQVLINNEPVGVPVTSKNKKTTEDLAYLVAAVTLTQKDPELLTGFQRALAAGGGTAILAPLAPLNLEVDEAAVGLMQRTLAHVRKLGLPNVRDISEHEHEDERSQMRQRPRLSEAAASSRSQLLQERLTAFNSNPEHQSMRDLRASLPMSQYSDKVLELVNNNVYSIIIGATGSGKTTQVPQILLDDAISKGIGGTCDVICTQPRRIAATSVARRVANERSEKLQESVGYHVRFDPKNAHHGGSINFCTTGILLQQLQRMPDEVFDTVSHIVVDEVHERDILIDFLMILLKKTVHSRRLAGKSVPKIILMSATIDSELFAKYFEETTKDGMKILCPSLSVPGRTFPVKERYYESIMKELEQEHGPQVVKALEYGGRGQRNGSLPSDDDTRTYMSAESSFKPLQSSRHASNDEEMEATIDWKRERTLTGDGEISNEKEDALVPIPLVATTIAHIAATSSEGAILVFLPGFDEIKKVRQYLEDSSPLGVNFKDSEKFKLSMLHSSVPASEQAQVFEPVAPGCRKIILSTNIAETSVTIPDIQYVVDTGKLREKRYDQVRRITKLQCTWISKSNAKQRAGRAGRVQNGNYYALFSKARYESFRSVGLPEMLRSDLQEICLDIKAQAFKTPIRDFLAQAIEPPSPVAVDSSVRNLIALEALTEDEKLTALGRVLASLPVHPTLGKMIILGIIFRCLDPMIILGAALNERSPFLSPPEKRAQAAEMHRRFLEGTSSDHVALINAIRQARMTEKSGGPHKLSIFANDHFIHTGSYRTIIATSQQIEDLLIDAHLIPYTAPRNRFDAEFGHPLLNKNANNVTLLKALTLAGTHPNLAVCRGVSFRTPGEKAAMIHPSSLNHLRPGRGGPTHAYGSLFSYSTMQKSNDGSQMLLRETSATTPLMATMFGGKLRSEGNLLKMDEWLPFYPKSADYRSASNIGRTIVDFRKTLNQVLAAAYASIKPQERNRERSTTKPEESSLADDPTREAFASGLVEILNNDVGTVANGQRESWRPSIVGNRDASSRDGGSDGGRYASSRFGSRDGGRDSSRISTRNSTRESTRDGTRDGGRDSGRDSAQNGTRESGRDGGRDVARDAGRDRTQNGGRDGGEKKGSAWASAWASDRR